LLSGFEEGFKCLPILGEHPDEPYPISHLGIAGNHGGGDQDGAFDGKPQIQIGPDWEWENCLDVAAAQAQIGSSATNRAAARVSLYLNRHTYLYACVLATVIRVVAHVVGILWRSAYSTFLLLRLLSRERRKLDVTRLTQDRRHQEPK
jgi:hypothetical protein